MCIPSKLTSTVHTGDLGLNSEEASSNDVLFTVLVMKQLKHRKPALPLSNSNAVCSVRGGEMSSSDEQE